MKAQTVASAGLLFVLRASAQQVIYSGEGFGTYYYDVQNLNGCGNNFANINSGGVECGWQTATTLNQINSDYVVAMNASQLGQDMSLYCGKKVVVSVNGVASNLPFFIGDGCARCGTGSDTNSNWDANGAPGLDFSYSALSQLSSNACNAGHIDITWEILDETVRTFSPSTVQTPIVEACSGGGPNQGTCQTAVVKAQANGPSHGGACNAWPFSFGNGWFTSNVWCQFYTGAGCTGTASDWIDTATHVSDSWFYSTQSFTCGGYVAE